MKSVHINQGLSHTGQGREKGGKPERGKIQKKRKLGSEKETAIT